MTRDSEFRNVKDVVAAGYLPLQEVADKLGLQRTTVAGWIRSKATKVKTLSFNGGRWMHLQDCIDHAKTHPERSKEMNRRLSGTKPQVMTEEMVRQMFREEFDAAFKKRGL